MCFKLTVLSDTIESKRWKQITGAVAAAPELGKEAEWIANFS
jgi:hypothetical protein